MAVSCAIPARLNSSRFPKKLLHPIKGKPLIFHTACRAVEANCFEEIVCMTDSLEIAKALEDLPIRTIITGPALNGTERIAANCHRLRSPLIVNLQGDEPFFPVEDLIAFSNSLNQLKADVQILVHNNPSTTIMRNPHRVKVKLLENGNVLDFHRQNMNPGSLNKGEILALQAGLYGYTREFLKKYLKAGPSKRELQESHEMLRILPLPAICALSAKKQSQSVDVMEDLTKIV